MIKLLSAAGISLTKREGGCGRERQTSRSSEVRRAG
jgi:hypothetical protein